MVEIIKGEGRRTPQPSGASNHKMMNTFRKSVKTVALIVIASTWTIAQDGTLGKITGAIYDYHDALILGTKVTVSNDRIQKTSKPDPQTGTFLFEVPPGVYSITTEQNWWFPIRRGKILVGAGKTVVINLQPNLRIASQALVVDTKGTRDVYERNALPALVELQPFSDSALDLVIEYRKLNRKGATTGYTHAQLTYNDLSIRADALSFNSQTLLIEASGNVTIDKGGSRQKKDRVTEQLVQIK
jgi:hypothetical protein